MSNLSNDDFSVCESKDGDVVLTGAEGDAWVVSYAVSEDKVKEMITELEIRMMKKIEAMEIRLRSDINEERVKRQFLKSLTNEYIDQFKILRQFLLGGK